MEDRTGQVWYDPEGSTYPELFLVTGGSTRMANVLEVEEGSVYHPVMMLYHGTANAWIELSSQRWEDLPHMKRIL